MTAVSLHSSESSENGLLIYFGGGRILYNNVLLKRGVGLFSGDYGK